MEVLTWNRGYSNFLHLYLNFSLKNSFVVRNPILQKFTRDLTNTYIQHPFSFNIQFYFISFFIIIIHPSISIFYTYSCLCKNKKYWQRVSVNVCNNNTTIYEIGNFFHPLLPHIHTRTNIHYPKYCIYFCCYVIYHYFAASTIFCNPFFLSSNWNIFMCICYICIKRYKKKGTKLYIWYFLQKYFNLSRWNEIYYGNFFPSTFFVMQNIRKWIRSENWLL